MTTEHRCVEKTDVSNVLVEERGRKANFPNAKREAFLRVKVDGCLITEGPRADWIITKVGDGSVLVELKGKDLPHACKQLFATAAHPECEPWLEKRRALLVVCSRYPSFDTSIARAKVEARKMGMRLSVACNRSSVPVEKLLHG